MLRPVPLGPQPQQPVSADGMACQIGGLLPASPQAGHQLGGQNALKLGQKGQAAQGIERQWVHRCCRRGDWDNQWITCSGGTAAMQGCPSTKQPSLR